MFDLDAKAHLRDMVGRDCNFVLENYVLNMSHAHDSRTFGFILKGDTYAIMSNIHGVLIIYILEGN